MIWLLLSKIFSKRKETPEETIQQHSELLDAQICLIESELALDRAKATVLFNKHRVERLLRLHNK